MRKLRWTGTILVIFLVISMIAPELTMNKGNTTTAKAAVIAKLSDSRLTIYVGEEYLLSISDANGKVAWHSDKSSVATVSRSGKVTAKKAGTAKVTGKVGKKSYVCSVTVKNNQILYGMVSNIKDRVITLKLGTLVDQKTLSAKEQTGASSEYIALTGETIDITIPKSLILSREEFSSSDNQNTGRTSSKLVISDILTGDILKVTYSSDLYHLVSVVDYVLPKGDAEEDSLDSKLSEITGTGAYNLKSGETLSGGTYEATKADESAIRADGLIFAGLSEVNVNKSAGDASNAKASSLYGLNSAIYATKGAKLSVVGGKVTSSADSASAIFAGEGTVIDITGTNVNVDGSNAGGLQVAGGGTIYATNVKVNTKKKAAIHSGQGGGSIIAYGGSYITSGFSGAPAIYSTAKISVNNALLTADSSEAVIVDGMNSVSLNDCTVTGNMKGTLVTGGGENIHNIMLYQSTSAGAGEGSGSFSMSGGTLTSKSGDMFYVTNTKGTIKLSNTVLNLADKTKLLVVEGNDGSRGWGVAGANGGDCTLAVTGQYLKGNITVDAISKLDMSIKEGSYFTGAINSDQKSASDICVSIDSSSTWTLTADSYITEFEGRLSDINYNGYTLYIKGVAKKQ